MSRDITKNNQWLRSFPTIATRVLGILADDDVPLVEMAREIQVDPVLTARILQVANSPLYQAKSEITTLQHAISWLGKSEIAGLVLSFQMGSFASDSGHFKDFWRQSFIQGCAMSRIAEASGQIQQGEAYICGLLMDFGRLMLLDGYPSGYGKIIDESHQKSVPLHQLEKEHLGLTHAAVGQDLMKGMNLPDRFGTVANLHILPPEELSYHEDNPDFKLVAAGVASAAIAEFFCRNNQGDSLSIVETVCRQRLHMGERDIQWVMDSVNSDIEDKADVFSVDVSGMLPIGQLIGHANCQIGQQAKTGSISDSGDVANQLEKENRILKQLVSSLEEKVCKDKMTGIYNRDYFTGQFEERVNGSGTNADAFSLMVIDIDKFKSINDAEGHLAGDQAITWTAGKLDSFFERHLVARYGGDEFVVIAEIDECDSLQEKLNRLCAEVVEQSGAVINREMPFTISIGAAICRVDQRHPSLAAHIFKMADMAMYDSKKAGGNRGHIVCVDELPEDAADISSLSGTPASATPNLPVIDSGQASNA